MAIEYNFPGKQFGRPFVRLPQEQVKSPLKLRGRALPEMIRYHPDCCFELPHFHSSRPILVTNDTMELNYLPKDDLPKPDDLEDLTETDEKEDQAPAELATTTLSNIQRSFISRQVEAVKNGFEPWKPRKIAENLRPGYFRQLSRLWLEKEESTGPPEELATEVAEKLLPLLQEICQSPKKILRRKRQMTALANTKKLDSACIRWLIRQPGRTHVERAGPRQEILSVVRIQLVDTLENRVLVDLMKRLVKLCVDYTSSYRSFRKSDLWNMVHNFKISVGRLRRTEELQSVGNIDNQYPQPNYVLLHDERYREIWKWYERIRRHQDDQQELWNWRERCWEEASRVLLASLLDRTLEKTGRTPIESVIHIRKKSQHGQHIDRRSGLGPWYRDPRHPVYFLSSRDLGDRIRTARAGQTTWEQQLVKTPPSFLFLRGNTKRPAKVVAVWTNASRGCLPEERDDVISEAKSAFEKLRPIQTLVESFQCLLIFPEIEDRDEADIRKIEPGLHVAWISPESKKHQDQIQALLEPLLPRQEPS